MSRLEKLIEELCPDGVEYVKLKEIANIGTGNSDRKNEDKEGEYPFFVRSKNILRSNKYLFDEEAIIIPGEGGIGEIFHYINGKYNLHQRAYRISLQNEKINAKYAYHYLMNFFKKFILMKAVSATVKSIRKPMIEDFPIPLPPLPVQEEIVRILDSFTKLTAELKETLAAELTARKKQYEYYRDEFFGQNYEGMIEKSKKDDIKLMTLDEVGKFIRGKRFVKKDMKEKGVPCIHYGDLYTHYGVSATKTKWFLEQEKALNMRYAEKNDVVIVQSGENQEELGIGVAWLGNEKVAIHDACYIFKHNINPKYISHYLRTNIYNL